MLTHGGSVARTRSGYIVSMGRPSQKLIFALALIVAIAGTFVFGFRAGRHARRIHWQNEPIHAWMSVPFIAHTHHVPPEILYQAIGLPPHQPDRRPLRRIAREEKRPVADLIRDLESAIANAPKGP
jgi:hypothetical protein